MANIFKDLKLKDIDFNIDDILLDLNITQDEGVIGKYVSPVSDEEFEDDKYMEYLGEELEKRLEEYNKPIIDDKLRPGEKMLESLINETQSMRLEFGPDGYMYIKPPFKNFVSENEIKDYNSTINPLNKEELKNYLLVLKLI